MSRTVTALYDTREEAETARQRLAAEMELGSARIHDQQSHGSGEGEGALNRLPFSQEDRPTYHEGIRRGGFLLTAEVRGHEVADKIIRLLEESASVDLDTRQEQWRSDGWSPEPAAPLKADTGSQEAIPIVEEELTVGRREVERGGARVRSYVREVPVHEQVTLREEHVSVERLPVDRPVDAAELEGDLLRERDVAMTATAEEPVVTKEAHVREEVVVTKTAEQRVEQVEDQVARTEIALENETTTPNLTPPQPAAGADFMTDTNRPASPAPITAQETTSSSIAPDASEAFPIGGGAATTAVPQPRVVESTRFEEARSSYQPRSQLVVEERTQSIRPSTRLVIGSAVAGAIAGSVIPFMLAGRKSNKHREVLLIEDNAPSEPIGHDGGQFPVRGRE